MILPSNVLLGRNCRDSLSAMLQKHRSPSAVLLVTSKGMMNRGTAKSLQASCPHAEWITLIANPNPEMDTLDKQASFLRSTQVSAIVALGGGSVIDSAKVLSVLSCHDCVLRTWLTSAKGKPTLHTQIPVIAIPTTAGTGAEVTPFATVWDAVEHKKYSLADPLVLPAYVLIDPELVSTLPRGETLYTGLDTISHALESLWNCNCTQKSYDHAVHALELAVEHLPASLQYPTDIAAREGMLLAALHAGMAIAITRTAIAHAMSYALTAHLGIPHGLACSVFLPEILECVNANNAWPLPVPASLLAKVAILLNSIDFSTEVTRYCAFEEIYSYIDVFSNQERGCNFTLHLQHLKNVMEQLFKTDLLHKIENIDAITAQ